MICILYFIYIHITHVYIVLNRNNQITRSLRTNQPTLTMSYLKHHLYSRADIVGTRTIQKDECVEESNEVYIPLHIEICIQ